MLRIIVKEGALAPLTVALRSDGAWSSGELPTSAVVVVDGIILLPCRSGYSAETLARMIERVALDHSVAVDTADPVASDQRSRCVSRCVMGRQTVVQLLAVVPMAALCQERLAVANDDDGFLHGVGSGHCPA
jgi:hypothetical protein